MEQKWEQKERVTEILRKHEGLTEEDIVFFWAYADANGMPIEDETLPIFATALVMRRDGKNLTGEMQGIRDETKSLVADFKDAQERFAAFLKQAFELEKEAARNRIEAEDKAARDRIEELDTRQEQNLHLATIQLETVSKEVVGKAIEGASAGLQEQVQKIANGVSDAVIEGQVEARAAELRQLDATHRKTMTIYMAVSAVVIVVSILMTALFTHVYTRENTLLVGNEFTQYGNRPNAEGYLNWLRLYDTNRGVMLRTCGYTGDEIVQKSGLCAPKLLLSDNVPRLFAGTPVLDQIETWFYTARPYWHVLMGVFLTLFTLISAPHVWGARWVVWLRRQLGWLWKPSQS